MRRLLLALPLLLYACGQGTLPSKPVVSGVWGTPRGDSLEIHWYSLEGADRYEVKGIGEGGETDTLYSGTDTVVVLGRRYPYYTVVAYAPSDVQESDTVKVRPLEGSLTLRAYGSGFKNAVCYDPSSEEKIVLCNPEDEEVQPNIILLLDSLTFISPSADTAHFGSLRVLYSSGPSDMAPYPPEGYADTYPVVPGDTFAGWVDRGIADTFDLTDNVLRVIVDSLYVGDGSRDSIQVEVSVRYQLVPRLRWY